MSPAFLVTGGAGYLGAVVAAELLASGAQVRVFDSLLHGQEAVASELENAGAEVVIGDVRDATGRRSVLREIEAVVHLAAIVGDPACARDPKTADAVNVQATRAFVAEARAAGVPRFVFASTCSNYGRMADPSVPIDETGELRPVSLYAEQKVEIERLLLARDLEEDVAATCLRFATIHGVAPRMRFDLTVNEFTRDLWAGRRLDVFGEQFWRPYVHVRDAARAVRMALEAPVDDVGGEVLNVGHTDENYRKVDLVAELQRQLGEVDVRYVHRDEDPRDYKVSFERVRRALGFEIEHTVATGIGEILAALDAGRFGDPFDPRHGNTPAVPLAADT